MQKKPFQSYNNTTPYDNLWTILKCWCFEKGHASCIFLPFRGRTSSVFCPAFFFLFFFLGSLGSSAASAFSWASMASRTCPGCLPAASQTYWKTYRFHKDWVKKKQVSSWFHLAQSFCSMAARVGSLLTLQPAWKGAATTSCYRKKKWWNSCDFLRIQHPSSRPWHTAPSTPPKEALGSAPAVLPCSTRTTQWNDPFLSVLCAPGKSKKMWKETGWWFEPLWKILGK